MLYNFTQGAVRDDYFQNGLTACWLGGKSCFFDGRSCLPLRILQRFFCSVSDAFIFVGYRNQIREVSHEIKSSKPLYKSYEDYYKTMVTIHFFLFLVCS